MRRTFPAADEVTVNSGRKAVVFNIKDGYRLITAVHYEKTVKDRNNIKKAVEGKIYLFFFLTHTEYDKNLWKAQL
jgi:mRNA interferase HigB